MSDIEDFVTTQTKLIDASSIDLPIITQATTGKACRYLFYLSKEIKLQLSQRFFLIIVRLNYFY
jgi:hypothetical protein